MRLQYEPEEILCNSSLAEHGLEAKCAESSSRPAIILRINHIEYRARFSISSHASYHKISCITFHDLAHESKRWPIMHKNAAFKALRSRAAYHYSR